MSLADSSPILVTGSHRSGTTWIGRMLGRSERVGYIHEPFRPDFQRGVSNPGIDKWFYYVCEENQEGFRSWMDGLLRFHYELRYGLEKSKSARDFARLVRDLLRFRRYGKEERRPLLKDPIALLSSNWLAQEFDMKVVVLIRHPAAFAASLLRKGYRFDFSDIASQPLLMRDYFGRFEDEIRWMMSHDHSALDEAILLWRLLYHFVGVHQGLYEDWLFVRHEDISRAPLEGFSTIFNYLGLDLAEEIRTQILRSTAAGSGGQTRTTGDRYRLDSSANVTAWKAALTTKQVERIRQGTRDVVGRFYGDDDW